MLPGKWTFSELPGSYRDILSDVYGYQSENNGYSKYKIQYIRTLTEKEQSLFARGSFVSPGFLIQALYKLNGSITPIRFNRMLWEAVKGMDIFRLNYCPAGSETLAVVFEERIDIPDVVYRNIVTHNAEELDQTLQRIMEADMRRGFDLERGHLIRFTVLHTAQYEYAVLVTAAQLIMDRIDMKQIFRGIAEPEIFQTLPAEQDVIDGAASRSRAEDTIREYWSSVLKNPPHPPAIPYREMLRADRSLFKGYRKSIPSDLMSDLRRLAKSNRLMLMAILQTAWAFMLQEYNAQQDVLLCLLGANRKKQGQTSSGAFHVMPVRCRSEKKLTVQKLVNQLFQQLVLSQPYSSFNWEDLKEIMGPREVPVNHFLSFYDFMVEEQRFSELKGSAEGTFVLQNAWDPQNTRLGVYFRYGDQGVTFSFTYDAAEFGTSGGERLSHRFLQVLQQMIADWDMSFGEFLPRLSDRLEKGDAVEETPDPSGSDGQIRSALERITLLQTDDKGFMGYFKDCAYLEKRFQGDRISGAEMEGNLAFVVEGKVVRNIDTGDGWYETLDIQKDGAWLNESVFLSEPGLRFSAEVLTDEAVILLMPLTSVHGILQKYPRIWLRIVQHNLRQLEKYQRLWVKS